MCMGWEGKVSCGRRKGDARLEKKQGGGEGGN